MQEISLRHDPYETSIIVQNGKASLIGLQQQARGVDERRARFHGCKRGSHNVRREHVLGPVTAFSFPMFDSKLNTASTSGIDACQGPASAARSCLRSARTR